MRNRFFLSLLLLLTGLSLQASKAFKANIVVAQDGSGKYTKIQDAINAVPSNSEKQTIIFIKNGIYDKEKILVPKDKKNITMIGESSDKTVISYHIYDCADGYNHRCPAEDAMKLTKELLETSASFTIEGDGFHAENITFQNTAGPVGQALAITVKSDKNIFINCRFLGYQDTIFLRAKGKRSYFKNCLVVGRTDYIYGAGIAYFDACEIRSFGGGWITAPATPKNQAYGIVFNDCKLTYASKSPRFGDDGRNIALGRPWQDYPKVAWIKCYMCKEIDPQGWPTKWHMDYCDTSSELKLYEYKNYGPGADMSKRAKWACIRKMNEDELQDYSINKVLGGDDHWSPTSLK